MCAYAGFIFVQCVLVHMLDASVPFTAGTDGRRNLGHCDAAGERSLCDFCLSCVSMHPTPSFYFCHGHAYMGRCVLP